MEILALIFLLICVILLALTKPKTPSESQYGPFYGRNIAHRGLHSKDQSIPENSIPAFRAAVEKGYGIELDLHLTNDGQVVVVHDDNLKRICGVDKIVKDLTYGQLLELNLFETEEKIPKLTEVRDIVSGKVPLIIELKVVRGDQNELCSKAWDILKDYRGDFCIESFNPFAVAWFNRRHANVYRGQLTDSYGSLKKSAPWPAAFVVANCLSNIFARPHFIAHSTNKKSVLVMFAQWLGAKKVVWTVRDEKLARKYEAENATVIFENYLPKPVYYKEK